jgi:glycerophosphoryl diester phosphodiesterase
VTLVLAHRGSGPHGPEPENSVAAFLAAARLGADGVELDVRRGRDGLPLVCHDATLADGRLLAELGPAELPSEVPSLAEALDACGGLVVNVEIKNWPSDPDYDPSEQVATATGEVLAGRFGDGQHVVVSSFSRRALRACSAAAPRVETAWLVGPDLDPGVAGASARSAGVEGLHPFESAVDAAYLEAARAFGLRLRVWTVDEPERITALARLGVDAVITNEVTVARRAVAQARLAKGGPGLEQSAT